MSITITDKSIINKDGKHIIFPMDAGGRPAPFLSGYDDTETLRVASLTSDGKLKVDATVTVGTVTIGDVTLKAKDSLGADGYVHRVVNPDTLTSGLYVQDQRMNFTSDELNSLSHGFDGSANVPLSVDNTGKLQVIVDTMPVVNVLSNDNIFATAAYITTDGYVEARDISVRGYVSKTIVIKNVGVNDVQVNVLGSVDETDYDLFISNGTTIVAGSTLVLQENKALTNIKIQAKSVSAGNSSTIHTRAYVMGA